jgi:hypothetical protein
MTTKIPSQKFRSSSVLFKTLHADGKPLETGEGGLVRGVAEDELL